MPIYLRQSTASQEVPLGYFLDSTDGNTEETGLTIANTDIQVWKNGATTLASKNSGGATHISTGIYYAVLDATDTDTLGPLVLFVHVSGALAVRLECVVLSANVYDSLIAASDNLSVDLVAGQLSIKKNVALSNFAFLMIDSNDHITAKTGLTVSATRSIDGGAFASCSNSPAEVANGIYKINLSAGDLNGAVITFRFTASGADDRFVTIITQA